MDRYRILFEGSRDAISIVTEDGDLVEVNQAWLDLFGFRRKDVPGLNVTQLYVNPKDRQMFRRQAMERGSVKDFELRLRKKNGPEIFCLATSTVKIRSEGTSGYLSIIRDVTERRKAEESLMQRQAALQAVYEMATTAGSSLETLCGQVAMNLSRLLKVSHAVVVCSQQGGRPVAAVVDGKPINIDLSAEDGLPRWSPFPGGARPCLTEAHAPLIEGVFREQYGVKSCLETPITCNPGKVFGVIGVMDRTERVFTSADLHLVEIFARYIAREIERQIMENQLRQSHRMKMVGQLAVGVAHEVRNPLGALLAITEALCQDLGDDAEHREHLDHIRGQVNRLSKLMFDLLNMGKPIQSSSLQPQSLGAICASAVDLWKQSHVAHSKRVVLKQPPHDADITLLADSAKMQQVLLNLLDNAEEASPAGTDIVVAVSEPKRRTVRVSVIDRGPGIKPDILSRIPEPFFTTKKGGTGLGLSIVNSIVEAHGGRVVIRNNEPPPGCAVDLVLPVMEERTG